MPKFLFTNRASATLASAITPTSTSLTLASGQGSLFPNPGADEAFHATLVDAFGNSEIVRCTARSGDVLTVVRGVENTTPRTFAAGSRVELRLTAEMVNSFVQGAFLPPLKANLDFGGFAPVNVNWGVVTIDAAALRVAGVPVVTTARQITVGPGMSGGGALNADLAIGLRFATNAEAEEAMVADRVLSPSHLGLFVRPAFTWIEPLVSMATVYTYNHGLNRIPLVDAGFRCRVANNGYQVGDVISVHSVRRGENNARPVVLTSTTLVELVMPTNLKFVSRSNPGSLVNLVENEWEIYVRGWRL